MVRCLGSVTATNLLTKFFLLDKYGHIINSLRKLAGTSKHLSTHSSFNANGLLTFVGNLGHNISDRLWFPYTRCHIIVRLKFRFIDWGILLASWMLGILGFLLLSWIRLLLLHLYLKLVSSETLSRCLLRWWRVIWIIILITISCFSLDGVLGVQTCSHFGGHMQPCVLMLHRHYGWAVMVRMIQLWLVAHHLLVVLFGEGTNNEGLRVDITRISFRRMCRIKTISRIPATHGWQLRLFEGRRIVLLGVLIHGTWTLVHTGMVAEQLALLLFLFALSYIEFFRLSEISRLISVYHQVGVVIHRFLFSIDGEVGDVVMMVGVVSSCWRTCSLSCSLIGVHV